ncbi:UDP-N-acetylmuramoyl-tripeptide--D-alanyl-D-alanine ligase [Maribacter vaceletii]|uniref:UDP-N-acetylmuramoyl-tripeptide--D-alanyl-D-alanine ligase n=1 Tax=Maribacter vaceletii TaxID=1206816 RepID=A0A495DU79_9FLAO|nr:UDP-N-acetylmuramoyl-tripeptide--D-alanyl-D-alanine ligase [Maribacter vaceletii]RKR07709.1 UDP-N-acetylmuramoyl-tripeptide--D-alanyl-D-alanine ligase [Maribacter vaceletii]
MTIQELHQHFLDFKLVSTDTRKISKNSIFFALKGDNFNGNTYAKEALSKGAILAIVDEKEYANSKDVILVNNVLTTLQQLANYHRNYCSAKIISITGSNGKTTTKELIHAVLSTKYKTIATKGNLNNHIGVPLTLLSIKEDTEIAVVEMGANHKKEIAFLCSIAEPDFGYITNFGKAHLEGFGSLEGVIEGKSELYDFLTTNKKQIFLNADDPIQKEKLGNYIQKFGFSTTLSDYYKLNLLEANPFVSIQVEDTRIDSQLIGKYNFTNCCAAIIMGKYFSVLLPNIKEAIENYVPENNRSQIIEKEGCKIILDAYNANPTSMKAALENFNQIKEDNKILFLGDMFELGSSAYKEHQNIADLAEELIFKKVYLIGENFSKTKTKLSTFNSFDTLKVYLEENAVPKNTSILIKGSRGMALERILDLIQ